MKILTLIKNNVAKILTTLSLSCFSLLAFAADPAPDAKDATFTNLDDLYNSVILTQGSVIFKITIAIATIAGIILIVKGLVHLKQNYTGTGQEKHLSKGIASLGFGTALILAIPISHALVGAASGSSSTAATSFSTGAGSSVDFVDSPTPKT